MAIPTKAKDILLLPLTDGGITQPFNMPGFPNYDSGKNKHNGLDIGWTSGHQYWPILACQDGTVVDIYNNNASIGNAVVLQHDYDDGTHRWTGYIHLKNAPVVKKGQSVKQGDQIGIRGGSPYVNGKAKYGVHLHLYLTKCTTAKYTWNTMKANVIDPLPLLYRSKEMKYDTLVGDISKLPFIEDSIPEVTPPVERNEMVDQIFEKSDKLRVRMTPSLKGTVIGYLQKDSFYNYYDIVNADNYEWYQIDANQWCAKTSTMVVYPKKTEVDILREKLVDATNTIMELNATLDTVKEENVMLQRNVDVLNSKIVDIRSIVADIE